MEKQLRFASIGNLRVIAIMAIMLNHAQLGIDSDTKYSLMYLTYGQFFKFGSLLFMIISGFLFEKSVNKYSTKQLIVRKALTILLPSLLFISPWIILRIGILPFVGENTSSVTWSFASAELYNIFFKSIYWFPINLFIILILNSFIKGTKAIKWFLIPAVLITLFYSINIYYHWVPRRHNSAILAFFSFFFAGRLLSVYYDQIREKLHNLVRNSAIKTTFIFFLMLFFSLAVFESYQIQNNITGTDPNNILRLSNIIYTLLFLGILYFIRNSIDFSRYFQDKTVFLIYLIHPYFLFAGKQITVKLNYISSFHSASVIPFEFVYAVIVLFSSLAVARAFLKNETFNTLIGARKVKEENSESYSQSQQAIA